MTLVALFERVELLSLPVEALAHGVDAMGTTCSGTLVTGDRFTVSQSSGNRESVFVHDPIGDATTEISRDTAALETAGGPSSLSLGGLYTDGSGVKTIQGVMSLAPDRSVLAAIEGSSVSSTTIDGSISWDRDDCCLYMSEDKVFRFRYNAGTPTTPPRLSLEALDQSGSAYVPKFEVEKSF